MCDSHVHDHHHHHGHPHPAASSGDGLESKAADEGGFRVVITGKGGVGKTSLTAMLSRLLARRARTVLALDADPQMNLPYALGLSREEARSVVPLSQNEDYVEEKTGVRPGSGWGLFLRLNPDVSDVVDRFGIVGPDGVRLLVMGTTVQPATGCLCPENTLLSGVVEAINLREGEAILMDTQAGVEHFGRALAKGFHHAVVVTDPTFNGVQVALQTARLARAMGIPAVHLVVNRVRDARELDRTFDRIEAEETFPFTSRHVLPYDEALLEVEPTIGPILDRTASSSLDDALDGLLGALLSTEETLTRCAS